VSFFGLLWTWNFKRIRNSMGIAAHWRYRGCPP
jgi:hypothetical protein